MTRVIRVSEGQGEKKGRGRPATGAAPQRQLGRVHDYLWEQLKEGAKLAGQPFATWAVHVLLAEATRLKSEAEKKKKKTEKPKE